MEVNPSKMNWLDNNLTLELL